jgi:D-glycero-alpha-D-manno-heptose-7-phosphate kinase
MRIKAVAPTRIDLAGGTLDLYLTSIDLDIEERYASADAIATDGALEIISRAVKFFRPAAGLNVTTHNHSKRGSGLGASSSLLVAVLAALNNLTGSGFSYDQLIDLAANLEAQCIRVPTGKQDYFAAVFGGVNLLRFEVGGSKRECLLSDADAIRELENRLILSYTGAPRFSGATNWSMIRNYIENNSDTVAGMKQIKEIAIAMQSCILNRNWDDFAGIVDREWQRRRMLAQGVTNDAVENVMRAALEAGALSNKLCGAGGGGCMITCIKPESRPKVEAALTAAGAEVLPFRIVNDGIKLERLP